MSQKPIVLHLYRSLLQKARTATQGIDHLFRFQRQPNGELWGKGLMYDIAFDRQLLESLLPPSVHQFLDNHHPFNPNNWNDNEGENHLHSQYYPDFIKNPQFDHAYNVITNEEKLKSTIPTQSTPKSSSLYSSKSNDIIINEYDYYRLKRTISEIFHYYKTVTDLDRINELINDGFAVLKLFDQQIESNETTSISESNGIRVIASSAFVAQIIGHDPYKPLAFTYRIRIENHSHSWVQLLGRHWVIVDANGNKEILERFQPGVVGLQPQLNPGDVFVYGSGTFMNTKRGKMYGAFQFTNMSGELFEVPICTFNLIARDNDSDFSKPNSPFLSPSQLHKS